MTAELLALAERAERNALDWSQIAMAQSGQIDLKLIEKAAALFIVADHLRALAASTQGTPHA